MELIIHTLDSAPADSRPTMEGLAADLGLLPNLAAVAAASPALLAGFDGLRRAVASTKLDPVLREVAGLAVGVAVDNRYGVAFHSTMLAGLGVDDAEIAAMRSGTAPSDPEAGAVYQLARDLVLGRGGVPDTTGVGLEAEQILEVVLECSFAALVGMIDNLAGHVELDGFLGPPGLAGLRLASGSRLGNDAATGWLARRALPQEADQHPWGRVIWLGSGRIGRCASWCWPIPISGRTWASSPGRCGGRWRAATPSSTPATW